MASSTWQDVLKIRPYCFVCQFLALFVAECSSTVWMHHSSFVLSLPEEQCCFQFQVVVGKKKDYSKYLCTGFVSAFLIFYFYFCKYSALSGTCI